MISDPWFYAVAVPAMIVLGLSKGGFAAIGILTVPIMALVISPVQAAGITLPILIGSDIVALASYRRSYDPLTLKIMLPAAAIGIGIGWATFAWVTESEIRLVVGILSVLFALDYWTRHRRAPEGRKPDAIRGGAWGVAAGFTSFVSHAGGPPFQIYAAPLRLPPPVFAGTSVILFAAINAIKVVPYFFLGQFATANLATSAILLPISIPATLLGVWLVKRFRPDAFYTWIYASILLVGLYLIYAGAQQIISAQAAA